MASSMQPVSMLMSNLNVESAAKHAPNALAAAQDTTQRQEIVQEGIRMTQRVNASEAMAQSQRVHRKNDNDNQNGRNQQQDSFEHTKSKNHEQTDSPSSAPLIKANINNRKTFDFTA